MWTLDLNDVCFTLARDFFPCSGGSQGCGVENMRGSLPMGRVDPSPWDAQLPVLLAPSEEAAAP